MTTNKFIGRGPKKVLAGVAEGIFVLSAGALLIQCTSVDEGSASASGQVAGTSSAVTSSLVETCPSPTPVPPLVDPDSGQVCHPSGCTPGFCAAATSRRSPASRRRDRCATGSSTLDCSPHSVAPLQVFAEADPTTQREPAVPVLPARQHGLPAQRVHDQDPRHQRRSLDAADRLGCQLRPRRRSARCASRSSPSRICRPIPMTPRAFIDIFTDIRGLFVINNESGWYEGWMIHDLRVAPVARPRRDGHAPVRDDHRRGRRAAAPDGAGNNVPRALLHRRRQGAALPEPERSLPGAGDQRRADPAQHGRVQLAPAVGRAQLLGVQLPDELDPPALRAAVRRRLPGPIRDRAADTYRGRRDRPAAVDRPRQRAG